jgi:ribonuclease HII
VILPRVLPESLQGKLRDSKLISAGERARLAEEIKACAVAWRVTEISSEVIDRINIAKAVEMAMYEAIHGLSVTPDFLLIDAVTIDIPIRQMAIEHGDALSVSIAAASILAKTHHSELMVAFDAEYPGYGLAKHKGYGTREHMAALELLGPTPLHRRSYAPIKALCRVQYNAQMV